MTIEQALIFYPELKKGYNEFCNAKFRAWFQANVSPSFLIQNFIKAKKEMDSVMRAYGPMLNAGRCSMEYALFRYSVEVCMTHTTGFYRVNFGASLRDTAADQSNDDAPETCKFPNDTGVSWGVLGKHFSNNLLVEMYNETGSLKKYMDTVYGTPFLEILKGGGGQNWDTFMGALYAGGTLAAKGYMMMDVESQKYLADKFKPTDLETAFKVGVNAFVDGQLVAYSGLPHINTAQLVWGLIPMLETLSDLPVSLANYVVLVKSNLADDGK